MSGSPNPRRDPVAIGLIGLGALLRILSFLFSKNTGGDAGAHLALAAAWLQHPAVRVIFSGYPPGHFWLIGLFSLVIHDVATAGRMVSLVLGISSLAVLWRLARVLYDESSAVLSLAVFAFYSLHIGYSTTTSAEVSYLFFLLLGMWLFFEYLHRDSGPWYLLAGSGVAMSASESIRYEAWIIFAALFVVLLFFWWRGWNGQRNINSLILLGVTGGAWPAFMMWYSWRSFGDPMYLVSANRLRVLHSLQTVSMVHQLTVVPVAVLLSLSPIALLGAFYGLARSFRDRFAGAFAALTLFFALVQGYKLISGGLLGTARYSITIGTLLAIVAGYGLQEAITKLAPGRAAVARLCVFALLFLNMGAVLLASELPDRFADEFASISPRLRYQKRILPVGLYLRSHMKSEDAVVIDDYNVESNAVADAAGLPILPGRRAYLASAKNSITVEQYVDAEHPRFLVYADRGVLRDSFPLAPRCDGVERLGHVEFRCVFESPIYRIYELSYPGS